MMLIRENLNQTWGESSDLEELLNDGEDLDGAI
jgi:hypothetical protein